MNWCGIEGHDEVVERFRQSIRRGRLAGSYLFVGPPGIGKRRFAKTLAQACLCDESPEIELRPCQQCPACRQVQSETHPDVEVVYRPDDRSFIPLELLIGDREHRGREGLCHRISLRPASGRRRIAIIDDADFLNQEGANSLLKILEEPPPRGLLVLIGTSLQRQLPTIRSRCQIVRFRPLEDEMVRKRLSEQETETPSPDVDLTVRLARGSLDWAQEFSDPTLRQFNDELFAQLSQANVDSLGVARSVQAFVEAAGSEVPARRQRLRQVVQLRMHRLQDQIRKLAVDAETSIEEGSPKLDTALERMDRCIDALRQIDANANLATLIESWVDDDHQAAVRRK